MKDQSLYEIMISEDQGWLKTITESSDVAWLIKKENKRAMPTERQSLKRE